jgi:hypothetical protein
MKHHDDYSTYQEILLPDFRYSGKGKETGTNQKDTVSEC